MKTLTDLQAGLTPEKQDLRKVPASGAGYPVKTNIKAGDDGGSDDNKDHGRGSGTGPS